MRYSRMIACVAALLVIAVALAGCAPRVGAGTTAAAAAPEDLVVDLPALVIDVGEDGALSMAGMPISQIVGSLGVPLEASIDPSQVAMLRGVGIQHIQIANQPDRLALIVNGIEMPSIGWSDDALEQVAGLLFAGKPEYGTLLPLLKQLGVGITLNLPVAAGTERAPLLVAAGAGAAEKLAAAQEAFTAQVGTIPEIEVPIVYAADGSWSIGGISGDMLIALTGQASLSELTLKAETIQSLVKNGIQSIALNVTSDGLSLTVGDKTLPTLDWSDGRLASLITLLQNSGMLSGLPIDAATLQGLLDQWLPMITTSNISLRAIFPTN